VTVNIIRAVSDNVSVGGQAPRILL